MSTQAISLPQGAAMIPLSRNHAPSAWIISKTGEWEHCYGELRTCMDQLQLIAIPPVLVGLEGVSVKKKVVQTASLHDLSSWTVDEVYLECHDHVADCVVSSTHLHMMCSLYYPNKYVSHVGACQPRPNGCVSAVHSSRGAARRGEGS